VNRILKLDSKKQRVWFVSDLHYYHGKPFIIGPRGYGTLTEAMQDLKQKWKQYVSPQDIVINLGDLIVGAGDKTTEAMYEMLALPCAHHYFLWGNHNAGAQQFYDKALDDMQFQAGIEVYPLTLPGYNFTYLGNYAEVQIDGQIAVLCHYPIASWNGIAKDAVHLHGHCHRNLKDDGSLKRIDVGWDWQKRPVEWNEIMAETNRRKGKPVDHHGKPETTNDGFFEKTT
jgi:calcineurin-like phosphoesterase family protein